MNKIKYGRYKREMEKYVQTEIEALNRPETPMNEIKRYRQERIAINTAFVQQQIEQYIDRLQRYDNVNPARRERLVQKAMLEVEQADDPESQRLLSDKLLRMVQNALLQQNEIVPTITVLRRNRKPV